MTSEWARPECDVRSRNALAAGTEQGSYLTAVIFLGKKYSKSCAFSDLPPTAKCMFGSTDREVAVGPISFLRRRASAI